MPTGTPKPPAAGRGRLSELCLDAGKPPEIRARLLLDVILQNPDPNAQLAVLSDLLRNTARTPEAEVAALKEAYEQGLAELQNGAVRPATFLGPAPGDLPAPGPRVHVVTPDGNERYPIVHSRVKVPALL